MHGKLSRRFFKIATITCALLTVASIMVFVATHNWHVTSVPGGFGDGEAAVYHAIGYGMFVVPMAVATFIFLAF